MDPEPYEGYFWQGEKIRLRGTRIEDAPKKWRERTDTGARRLLEAHCELPAVSLAEYTEQFRQGCEFKDTTKYTAFSIDTLDGEFIGWLNLFLGEPRHGTFSFGVGIFREYRQRGYALEAVRIILRYGFKELRCQKCDSVCLSSNEASIRFHEKLGFKEEGRRRRVVFIDGQYFDEILFGMLYEEFEEETQKLFKSTSA